MQEISDLQTKYKPYTQTVARFMNRCYQMGLTSTSGGNISLRIDDKLFAITPSQTDKGAISYNEIALVTIEGENLTPSLKLSIESEMHRLILCQRPDVNAIVHAHPNTASLFSATNLEINTSILAEHYAILGKVVKIPYALMGTQALAKVVADSLTTANAGLLENHGAIALGINMLKAFDRLELIENAAKITLNALLMEKAGVVVTSLNQSRINEIDNAWK